MKLIIAQQIMQKHLRVFSSETEFRLLQLQTEPTTFGWMIYFRILSFSGICVGIQNGYLSDIFCRRVDIGYDLSNVRSRCGDYAPEELDEAMEGTADVAEAYEKLAEGATLIFAVSVHQAEEIAARIPGAVAVTGDTKGGRKLFGSLPMANTVHSDVMVFTEGTDIPKWRQSLLLDRRSRIVCTHKWSDEDCGCFPGKERLNLIDCVELLGKRHLHRTSLGIDLQDAGRQAIGNTRYYLNCQTKPLLLPIARKLD